MRYWVFAPLAAVACSGTAPVQVEQQPTPDSVLEVVVANQGSRSASVLDDAGITMRSVAVGEGPHEAAVSPDGRIAVVTIYGAQVAGNRLSVIDLVRDSVIRTIDLGSYTRPHGVVFLGGSSSRVAVSSESTQNVVLVNVATGTIEGAVPTQARASHMVAATADGNRAFTANVIDHSVSELDLVNRAFVRSFRVPEQPEGIAVTPDGREVWVGSNATGAVSIISTSSGTITHTLPGIVFPYRLTASPNGELMAIVDGQGDRLFIASVADHRVVGSVQLTSPRGVAFSPDSKTAYVTLGGGSLSVIDVAGLTVVRSYPVQVSPDGVGVGVRR
jgi:DNA-binding beta-propeller fold protein YncE